MTCTEFKETFKKVWNKYHYQIRSCGVKQHNYMKCLILIEIKYKLLSWIENDIKEIPQKIVFPDSIKRKYVVSLFSELGLKVTHYTREYGKTIVHFEPVSNSQ